MTDTEETKTPLAKAEAEFKKAKQDYDHYSLENKYKLFDEVYENINSVMEIHKGNGYNLGKLLNVAREYDQNFVYTNPLAKENFGEFFYGLSPVEREEFVDNFVKAQEEIEAKTRGIIGQVYNYVSATENPIKTAAKKAEAKLVEFMREEPEKRIYKTKVERELRRLEKLEKDPYNKEHWKDHITDAVDKPEIMVLEDQKLKPAKVTLKYGRVKTLKDKFPFLGKPEKESDNNKEILLYELQREGKPTIYLMKNPDGKFVCDKDFYERGEKSSQNYGVMIDSNLVKFKNGKLVKDKTQMFANPEEAIAVPAAFKKQSQNVDATPLPTINLMEQDKLLKFSIAKEGGVTEVETNKSEIKKVSLEEFKKQFPNVKYVASNDDAASVTSDKTTVVDTNNISYLQYELNDGTISLYQDAEGQVYLGEDLREYCIKNNITKIDINGHIITYENGQFESTTVNIAETEKETASVVEEAAITDQPESGKVINAVATEAEIEAKKNKAITKLQAHFRGKQTRNDLKRIAELAVKDNDQKLEALLNDEKLSVGAFRNTLATLTPTKDLMRQAEEAFTYNATNPGEITPEDMVKKRKMEAVTTAMLAEEIKRNTLTTGKLERYKEVLGDLNEVNITYENDQGKVVEDPVAHYAAKTALTTGHTFVIGQLFQAGVDLDQKNKEGKTPLQVLLDGDYPEGRNFDRTVNALIYCDANRKVLPQYDLSEKDVKHKNIKDRLNRLEDRRVSISTPIHVYVRDEKQRFFIKVAAQNAGKDAKRAGIAVGRGAIAAIALGWEGVKFTGKVIMNSPKIAVGAAAGASVAVTTAALATPVFVTWAATRALVETSRVIDDYVKTPLVKGARIVATNLPGNKMAKFKDEVNLLKKDIENLMYPPGVEVSKEDKASFEKFKKQIDEHLANVRNGSKENVTIEIPEMSKEYREAIDENSKKYFDSLTEKVGEISKLGQSAKEFTKDIHKSNDTTNRTRERHAQELANGFISVGAGLALVAGEALKYCGELITMKRNLIPGRGNKVKFDDKVVAIEFKSSQMQPNENVLDERGVFHEQGESVLKPAAPETVVEKGANPPAELERRHSDSNIDVSTGKIGKTPPPKPPRRSKSLGNIDVSTGNIGQTPPPKPPRRLSDSNINANSGAPAEPPKPDSKLPNPNTNAVDKTIVNGRNTSPSTTPVNDQNKGQGKGREG